MSVAGKPTLTSYGLHIGRVGALALALGIGTAIAAAGAAHADDTGTNTPHSSTSSASSSASTARAPQRTSAVRSTSSQASSSSAPSAAAVKPSAVIPAAALRQTTRLPVTSTNVVATSAPAEAAVAPVTSVVASVVTTVGALTTSAQSGSGVASAAATSGSATTTVAAATPSNVIIEAETLTFTSKVANTITDSTATGKKALQLTTNGAASTTVTLPAFTSLVIRAKGDQYQGAPIMTVSVDGKVVATTSVSVTTWTDYTFPVVGTAGTHTISIGYTNYVAKRRLKIDTITVVAGGVSTDPTPPTNPAEDAPYFQDADWLWNPIASNPALAANSATWVKYFTAAGTQRVANLYQYGVTLINTATVTSSTPRYDVKFTKKWGSDPFGSSTVAIPRGTKIPTGTDGQVAILDPIAGKAFGIWQAKYNSTTDTWSGSWGGSAPLNGNGIDTAGSATATGISRYAGVITAAEFSNALAANSGINHALVFSTDIAASTFVGPAIKSDGTNRAAVAVPIPEGYRIQLDPSIDIDAIPGITPGEKVIAKTLQTYGAYVVDQGGARMAFVFEVVSGATATDPGAVWTNAGLAWDYYDMQSIPWAQLRVLAS